MAQGNGAAAPKSPRSRWEKPEFPRQPTGGANAFAPNAGKAKGRAQLPPLTDDDLDMLGYEDDAAEGAAAESFPLDAFSDAHDFDDNLPPFEDEMIPAARETEPRDPDRRRRHRAWHRRRGCVLPDAARDDDGGGRPAGDRR